MKSVCKSLTGKLRLGAFMIIGGVMLSPSAALADSPTSKAYGGSSGAIDTPAKVRDVVTAIGSQPSVAAADAMFGGLTQADQATVVREGLQVAHQSVTITTTDAVTPTAVAAVAPNHRRLRTHTVRAHAAGFGCWRYKAEVAGKSVVGNVLYYYDSHWSWCGNFGSVTSASHYEDSAGTFLLWQYDGSVYQQASGGIGQWYIGRQTQGTFHLNCPWGGSCQQSFATIDFHAHGDGSWWYSSSTTGI
jgi:hypothetical protein